MRSPKGRRRAFTLIELLVVIAIIAILVALLLPAVQAVREAARKSQCQDHLHNLAIGVHNYENAYKVLPPGTGPGWNDATKAQGGFPGYGWAAFILPNIEQKPLFDGLDLNRTPMVMLLRPSYNDPRIALLQTPLDIYRCPSDTAPETNLGLKARRPLGVPGPLTHNPNWDPYAPTGWFPATSNYVGNAGTKRMGNANNTGPLARNSSTRMGEIKDGTSNVFLVGERGEECAAATWIGARNAQGSGNVGVRATLGNVMTKPNLPYLFSQDLWADLTRPNVTAQPYQDNICIDGFSSKHPGGTQFGLADGKVTFVSENIDTQLDVCNNLTRQTCHQNREEVYFAIGVYQRLGNMQDGHPVDVP